jgi:hypothetical protein
MLHAHIETAQRDCDGLYTSGYMMPLTNEEIEESKKEVNDFHEIHFMNRIMGLVACPYAILRATVKIDEDGIEVREDTEEGFRNTEVRWCKDESCTEGSPWQRDHTAEAAGY